MLVNVKLAGITLLYFKVADFIYFIGLVNF